jgi:hypothetical protein
MSSEERRIQVSAQFATKSTILWHDSKIEGTGVFLMLHVPSSSKILTSKRLYLKE